MFYISTAHSLLKHDLKLDERFFFLSACVEMQLWPGCRRSSETTNQTAAGLNWKQLQLRTVL